MPSTITVLLRDAQACLEHSSTTPRLDAELILAHLLGWPRARLLAERDHSVASALAENFSELMTRRAAGEPVAYLLGHKEFYGLDLAVDRRVLVPRPETELLVELALAAARRVMKRHAEPLRIIDIGTGSGAVAIALSVHLPEAHIDAVDISDEALTVAQENVERHKLTGQIHLLLGDLFATSDRPYNLIVSNPPYTILAEVEPNVRAYEPHLALAGGSDGADIYRRIFAAAPAHLCPGGALLCEIGAWQGTLVANMARAAFPAAEVQISQDLAGRDRVVSAISSA